MTSEEKEAMTEKEIEEWEKKIKDSVLRRDSNLSTVGSALKEIMASGFEVNGTTMHLSDFGIATLGYFKKMKSDYDDYTSKIKDLEDKLTAYEDKWYAKFSAMETALAKMQSNANAVTSLLGGS